MLYSWEMCGLQAVCVSWVSTQTAELPQEGRRVSKASAPPSAQEYVYRAFYKASCKETFLFKSPCRR